MRRGAVAAAAGGALTDWAEIVGLEHARPGTRGDAVDGVVPAWVVRPGSVEEVQRCLAANGAALVVSGLGRHLDCGAPPARLDLRLCLDRLARVVDHPAADMTVTVEAGCPLSTLASTLASAGQWLPLDPPAADATTVGGLIATNFSGPLATSQGTVRDFLIGIRVVGADGTLVAGGGRVVKNVAGYDLPKLHVGAFGTVGVIVEATFKVRPRPAGEVALVADCASAAEAVETALSILDSSAAPLWVEAVGPGVLGADAASVMLAVGMGGLAEEVAAARARVEELVRARGLTARQWQGQGLLRAELADFTARPAAAILCAATLPTVVAEVLDLSARTASDLGTPLRFLARPGRGVIHWALGDGARLAAVVKALRPGVESRGGSLVVERAAPALKAGLEVWGDIGPALALMRGVKAAYDPDRRLAPGRFVGGL